MRGRRWEGRTRQMQMANSRAASTPGATVTMYVWLSTVGQAYQAYQIRVRGSSQFSLDRADERKDVEKG
jgi:hypothetical protein